MCLAQLQAEHRGQLCLISAFRRTAEVCQVGNMAACEGQPFTRVSSFCRGLLTVMVAFNVKCPPFRLVS